MLKITQITVITGPGSDTLLCTLDATPSVWPWNAPATARIDCAQGTAKQWLADNSLENIPTTWVQS
jgi:hypothetical protein